MGEIYKKYEWLKAKHAWAYPTSDRRMTYSNIPDRQSMGYYPLVSLYDVYNKFK